MTASIAALSSSQRQSAKFQIASTRPIEFADDVEAARVLGVPPDGFRHLRARNIFSNRPSELALPAAIQRHPLPQSTYATFARARPGRVKNGYDGASTHIQERIGAFQLTSSQYWVGKTFYDGEGTTGVGAIGYLDRAGRYTFLQYRSVRLVCRQFVVEETVIWAGRVAHPEGPDQSGGLLEYDRKTGVVTLHDVPD